MTKKIFMSALSVVVLLAAGYTGYKTMPVSEESNLLLDNVEALARGEAAAGYTVDCYSSSESKKGASYYDCGKCELKSNSKGEARQELVSQSNLIFYTVCRI